MQEIVAGVSRSRANCERRLLRKLHSRACRAQDFGKMSDTGDRKRRREERDGEKKRR